MWGGGGGGGGRCGSGEVWGGDVFVRSGDVGVTASIANIPALTFLLSMCSIQVG